MPTRSDDLDTLLDAALAAAHAGGAIVRDAYGDAHEVREKGPGDWVSQADTASERAVRAVLEAAAPDIPVHGEEEGGDRAARGWLVDPLDGTANFLHRFPIVGVSVGLIDDGEPIVGVVHAPLLGDTYTARRGGGAFCNGRPLRVSDRPPSQAILATGTPFRAKRTRLSEYLPGLRAGAARLRGPPPGRRGQPRPRLDRHRQLRRLLRSRARPLGRRRRCAPRPRSRRPGHRLGRPTRSDGSPAATSSPPPQPSTTQILDVIARASTPGPDDA